MQKLLLFVDKVSTFVGQTFSWLIVALTLLISWEVYSRYALDHPHAWAFDVMIMLYGTLFMMAGAYTLAKNSHVRGDVLYGFFPPRLQAGLDLTLYFLFFLPGIVAFVWAGYIYAGESWAINEHSNITSEGPPVYPFKTVIPVAGALILNQGIRLRSVIIPVLFVPTMMAPVVVAILWKITSRFRLASSTVKSDGISNSDGDGSPREAEHPRDGVRPEHGVHGR